MALRWTGNTFSFCGFVLFCLFLGVAFLLSGVSGCDSRTESSLIIEDGGEADSDSIARAGSPKSTSSEDIEQLWLALAQRAESVEGWPWIEHKNIWSVVRGHIPNLFPEVTELRLEANDEFKRRDFAINDWPKFVKRWKAMIPEVELLVLSEEIKMHAEEYDFNSGTQKIVMSKNAWFRESYPHNTILGWGSGMSDSPHVLYKTLVFYGWPDERCIETAPKPGSRKEKRHQPCLTIRLSEDRARELVLSRPSKDFLMTIYYYFSIPDSTTMTAADILDRDPPVTDGHAVIFAYGVRREQDSIVDLTVTADHMPPAQLVELVKGPA